MAEEIITSTNAETATDHEYNASEIQVLKGLEAVRKRPGMYIGSTGERGLHHLVYEIVDNAIDEALAGYCDHIEVKILKDNIIQVTDNGRGIPVDIQADTGLPAVTVVYTILHAGGKFGGENSGYKVAGGLHGVGASVVNACSEWLTVNVRRDGHEYEQTFRRGDPDGPLKCIGTVEPGVTGTRVTFKPDPEMFDTLEYDYETLHTRMREQAFLNAGLHITISDERKKKYDFSTPYTISGIQALVKKGNEGTIKTADDLKGKKVGVGLGTNYEEWLRQNVQGVDVRTYDDDPTKYQDLRVGRIDAILVDRLAALDLVKKTNDTLAVTGEAFSRQESGVALRKGNEDLLKAVNDAIAEMQKDGTLQALSEKWFGADVTK